MSKVLLDLFGNSLNMAEGVFGKNAISPVATVHGTVPPWPCPPPLPRHAGPPSHPASTRRTPDPPCVRPAELDALLDSAKYTKHCEEEDAH